MAEADDTSLLAGGSMRHGKPPRDCAICGVEFVPRFPKTVTCGRVCGKRLADWSRSAAYLAARARQCQHCGVTFVMASPSGKAMKGQVTEGRFCSRKCQADAARIYPDAKVAKMAERARYLARLGRVMRQNGPCDVCGGEIPGTRPRLTCSDGCYAERNRRKAREASIAADARDRSPRPCRCCGKSFVPEYGNRRRLFCSAECLRTVQKRVDKSLRRARIRATAVEPVDPIKVFERDGWRCHLCKRSTPKKLRGTCDGRAPELDHIQPLARGGSHTYANTACACRSCNQAKGARPMGQMMLFASPEAAAF